jgi:hypothetical protein
MLLSFAFANAQAAFRLKDSFKESDINYYGLSNINKFRPKEILDSVFNIKAGKYEIYRFIRENNYSKRRYYALYEQNRWG